MGEALRPSSASQPESDTSSASVPAAFRENEWATVHDAEQSVRAGLPFLDFEDADTLVFIDPVKPVKVAEWSFQQDYSRHDAPLRVHSAKLLAADSSVFRDLLSPTRQYRIARWRRCVPLPDGIRFVLDLTPPEEGDEAVELTSSLSCSRGVREWHLAAHRFGAPARLVGGNEDSLCLGPAHGFHIVDKAKQADAFESPLGTSPASPQPVIVRFDDCQKDELFPTQQRATGSPRLERPSKPAEKPVAKPEQASILDYTTTRHRAGIERLLHAIEGLDPGIDSAPKMWTLFGLAKYFDSVGSVVDWILPWIYTPENTAFIETLPELSAKLAEGLCSYDLCRDAFAILVGEGALAWMMAHDRGITDPRTTAYGRRREDLGEEFQTRVEYASKSLADRVTLAWAGLVEEPTTWFQQLPEYHKISTVERYFETAHPAAKGVREALQNFLLRRLEDEQQPSVVEGQNVEDDSVRGAYAGTEPLPYGAKQTTYGRLTRRERLFTKAFWTRLRNLADGKSKGGSRVGLSTGLEPLSNVEVVETCGRFNQARARLVAMRDLSTTAKSNDDAADTMESPVIQLPLRLKADQGPEVAQPPSPGGKADTSAVRAASKDYFDVEIFMLQASQHIQDVANQMLVQPVSFDMMSTETLTCLGDDEFKYLPLWAGGDDDGSGGVFGPSVPDAEAGPSGLEPTAQTRMSGVAGSDYSIVPSHDTMSSLDPSLVVHDGHRDQMHRRQVVSEASHDLSLCARVVSVQDDHAATGPGKTKGEEAGKGKGRAAATGEDEDKDEERDDVANTSLSDEDWDGGDEESFDLVDLNMEDDA
ncbi:MAG: hypothetical protein M1838_000510 [Thelocarpon superellum]|nr:MAG: hypothetical protein M1838_000510 [Thelocarpon superellum]